MDLTTAASTRLERLRQVLEHRVRRSIDTAPPLIRAGVLVPLVARGGGIEYLVLAPDEVKSLLVVPVAQLLDPEVHATETRSVGEQQYRIHYYTVGDDVIWGATGRIVYQFLKAWEEAA